jgi:hypothetical protein
MRFLTSNPWPIMLVVVAPFCLPLAVRQAQRWADARQSVPSRQDEDEIAELHIAFTREWQSIRLDAKDEQQRQQLRRDWRARYDSALRKTYQRQGREMPHFPHQCPTAVVFRALTPCRPG